MLCMLAISGCAHIERGGTAAGVHPAERDRALKVLVAHATPGNLAAAALLAEAGDLNVGRPLELIARAEALAPQRPELIWLHLALCERLRCDAQRRIEAHLQTVDPGNGFAWTSDLERSQASGSDVAVTAAILRIGAGPRMTYYWNQLEVMMVDALAVANPSESLAKRGMDAIGLLTALTVPPLQPISKACRREQLDVPGRRAACEAMAARMERSSTVISQAFALDLQERWWPAGSRQREVLQAKRRQLDYVMVMSSHTRWWRANQAMAIRLAAARRTEREEDVELAVMEWDGVPLEPPVDWKDPYHPG